MTGDSAKLRDAALKHYKAGRFAEAVQLQVQVVNAIGGLNPDSLDDQKRLAAFLFALGDHKSTAAVMGQVVRLAPDDAESLTNHGVALSRIGQHEAAVQSLRARSRTCAGRAQHPRCACRCLLPAEAV
jgi:tetratricopeptide (TPR) repeat protein